MSTTSTQYLLYASLLLGSIGTFHALKDPKVSDANGGDIGLLSERLEGLEKWKDARVNASRNITLDAGSGAVTQALLDRLADVELLADANTQALTTMRTDVDNNESDLSTYSIDQQEQISTNRSGISRVELTADTTEDTLTNILTPRVDTVEGNITSLKNKHSKILQRVKTNEKAIEDASGARETIGGSVTEVSGRVTENTQDIQDIEDALEGVYSESIESNKDNIAAVAGDFATLSEKLVRSGDNIVCTGLLDVRNGADISLDSNYLRLGLDEDMMVYMSSGTASTSPSGEAPAKGWGFDGDAFRVRVPNDSTAGFIVENSNEEALFSIRGSDGFASITANLKINGWSRVFRDGTDACFGNDARANGSDCAIKQSKGGDTTIAGKEQITLFAEGEMTAYIRKGQVTIPNILSVDGTDVGRAIGELYQNVTDLETRMKRLEDECIMDRGEINIVSIKNHPGDYNLVRSVHGDTLMSNQKNDGNAQSQLANRFYLHKRH